MDTTKAIKLHAGIESYQLFDSSVASLFERVADFISENNVVLYDAVFSFDDEVGLYCMTLYVDTIEE